MAQASIAAIIPVYNRPRQVIEALDSVAAQTHRPDAVIVVDDGSTDETAAGVESWLAASHFSATGRLIRQANAGVSAARNRGVAEAGPCDFLAFLDSDDLWPPDYLARMVEALASNPRAVAASCDLRKVDAAAGTEQLLSASRLHGNATVVLFDRYCPTPSCTVVRAEPFKAIGGFDSRYHGIEDHDLFLRLSLRGPWAYVPGPPVIYRSGTQTVVDGPPHLGERMSTPEQRLAEIQMLERFLIEHGGAGVVPWHRQRHYLARRWHRLGEMHQAIGQRREALAAFKESLRYYPLYYRSLIGWLRTVGRK